MARTCIDLIKRYDAAAAKKKKKKKNAFDLKVGVLQPMRAYDRAKNPAGRKRAETKARAAFAALTAAERRKGAQLMDAWGAATRDLIKAGCSRGRR